MAKEGKKKHHVGLIILITFLTVFLVIPVAFIFIFIFDTSTKDLSNLSTKSISEVTANMLDNAFDSTSKTGLISMKIGEDEINSILLNAPEKLGNVKQFVPKIYVDINEDNYKFCVDLQASFFKTRAWIDTKLTKEGEGDDQTLVFQISNIGIGRAGFLGGIIKNIASSTQIITDEKISSFLAIPLSSGETLKLGVKPDLANMKITYKRSDFASDFNKILNDKLGDSNLFLKIISQLFEDKRVLKTNYNGAIQINFDLNDMKENSDEKLRPVSPLKPDLATFNKNTQDIYNEGLIENDTQANYVYEYFLKGNKLSTDSEAYKFIDSSTNGLKAKLAELVDKTTWTEYSGALDTVITKDNLIASLENDIKNQITAKLPKDTGAAAAFTSAEICDFDITNLNNFVKTLDFFGYNTFITTTKDDKKTLKFITLDNFNFKVVEEEDENGNKVLKLVIFIGLNVNGFETTVIIKTTKKDTTGNTIEFTIDDDGIYLGNISANEIKDNIIDLLKSKAGSTEGDFFEFTNDSLKINFDKTITTEVKTAITNVETAFSIKFGYNTSIVANDKCGSLKLILNKVS